MNDEYYWELRYGDRDDVNTLMIPPQSVQVVKTRWDNGDPIHTPVGSIPANQIRSFQKTGQKHVGTRLLEEASRAFREPLYSPDGSITMRWVKMTVSQSKWEKFYAVSPGYKFLAQDNGVVLVAFRVPTHTVSNNVTLCNDVEIKLLNSR